MIGNKNMSFTLGSGIEAAANGVQMVVANAREKFPKADVISVKIPPAHAPGNRFYEDIKKTNLALNALRLDRDPKVQVLDLTGDFLNTDGTLKQGTLHARHNSSLARRLRRICGAIEAAAGHAAETGKSPS